jgi:tetratricopeptide (TPR) repeat protein
MRSLLWLLVLTFCTAAAAQEAALAGDSATVAADTAYNYKSLYENGFYDEAAKALEIMIKQSPDSAGEDPLKTLAFTYILLGRPMEARVIFKTLLSRNQDFSLDPIMTPPRFFEVFHQARAEWLVSAEGQSVLKRKKAQEDSVRTVLFTNVAKQPLLFKLKVLGESPVVRIPISLLPGGAGQFYNGKPLKGAAFLAAECASLAASIWAYYRYKDVADPQYGYTPSNRPAARKYINYMRIGFGTFSLVYLGGVVEAFINPLAKEKRE